MHARLASEVHWNISDGTKEMSISATSFLTAGAPGFEDKRNHVLASVTNALSSLKDILGAPVILALERDLDERCFMLGGLHIATNKLPVGVIKEMNRLLGFFERAIQPPPPPEACPV